MRNTNSSGSIVSKEKKLLDYIQPGNRRKITRERTGENWRIKYNWRIKLRENWRDLIQNGMSETEREGQKEKKRRSPRRMKNDGKEKFKEEHLREKSRRRMDKPK